MNIGNLLKSWRTVISHRFRGRSSTIHEECGPRTVPIQCPGNDDLFAFCVEYHSKISYPALVSCPSFGHSIPIGLGTSHQIASPMKWNGIDIINSFQYFIFRLFVPTITHFTGYQPSSSVILISCHTLWPLSLRTHGWLASPATQPAWRNVCPRFSNNNIYSLR